ncbi:hypothetical protein [Geodermatophilus normandii]|uniref:Alpha/beta hydrolase n=1 Tax=Geodermatophilus normandii TaxID=1137989 RepID=A0A6P0GFL6_9ACTN|nr:hypothetical protein [Geodermatophilus normandii]NEM06058.1 hypothetical protein [Geodermatophilus normandii]
MVARLVLDGRVVDADSGAPLAGMAVTAITRSSSPLPGTVTDGDGAFRLEAPLAAVPLAHDASLAVVVSLDRDGAPIHRTAPIPLSELATDDLQIAVPGADLASVFTHGELVLTTDSGAGDQLTVGETLVLSATRMRPGTVHTVTLTVDGEPYASRRLVTDQFGTLPSTVVAPQFGLAAADADGGLTKAEAARRWADHALSVAVDAAGRTVASATLPVVDTGGALSGFVCDGAGRPSEVVSRTADPLFLSLDGVPGGTVIRVSVVPSQAEWVVGDAIEAVADADSRPLVVETVVGGAEEPVRLFQVDRLEPGSFDLVVRPVRYGFEADEVPALGSRDLVVGRFAPGLLVRDRALVDRPVGVAAAPSAQTTGAAAPEVVEGGIPPGSHVLPDPGTLEEFRYVGAFAVDAPLLLARGLSTSLTVEDENTAYFQPGAFTPVSRTFPRRALVRFPADAPGATTPAQISTARPDYPVVVVVHGNGHQFTSYAFLLEHLAANGFVTASIHMPNGVHGLARANAFFDHLGLLRSLFGAVLQNTVGVLGHSRGGEAVFKIARLNRSLGLAVGLRGVLALAPTDQYGREALVGPRAVPLHVVYGAKDADVSGWPPYAGYDVRQTGFSLYDRADGRDKSMTFVENATHNGFVTTNEAAPAPLLPAAAQRAILLADANAFFRATLRQEPEWTAVLRGDRVPPSVASTGARIHHQYRSTRRRTLDDFEGAHTPSSWKTGTLGGAVSQVGLPADPVEAQLYPHDDHSPHDTGGLRLAWNSTTDALSMSVPPAARDVQTFAVLSFSVARVVRSPLNPATRPQDLRVVLEDGSGHERSVRVSEFGSIPVAAAANEPGNVKSAMTTVRIPLAAYTSPSDGAEPVDLSDVVAVRFAFTELPTGEVALDNVEFCD